MRDPYAQQPYTPPSGPLVHVEGFPISCRVIHDYSNRGNDKWRGKVAFFLDDQGLFEVEGTLKDGRQGAWFAPPSRSYETREGRTKWVNSIFFNDDRLGEVARMAVEAYLTDGDVNGPPIP